MASRIISKAKLMGLTSIGAIVAVSMLSATFGDTNNASKKLSNRHLNMLRGTSKQNGLCKDFSCSHQPPNPVAVKCTTIGQQCNYCADEDGFPRYYDIVSRLELCPDHGGNWRTSENIHQYCGRIWIGACQIVNGPNGDIVVCGGGVDSQLDCPYGPLTALQQ